jgi:RND family efflux transporter MFP subunit
MKKIIVLFKTHWIKVLIAVLLIAGVSTFLSRNETATQYIYTVGVHDVQQVVLLSGQVKAVGQADLSFDAVGRVATTTVQQGDVVQKGDVLAELDYTAAQADLLQAQGTYRSAKSGVSLSQAAVDKARANLSLVQAQNRGIDSSVDEAQKVLDDTVVEQEALVRSAYVDLLNTDLQAYPDDNYQNVPAPIVTGNYSVPQEGSYFLDFYGSGTMTGYSANVTGLAGRTLSFSDFGIPVALGTDGLYVTLPESGRTSTYTNTNWIIPVPNVRSDLYQTKKAAYEKAKQTQALAVSKAESNLNTLLAQRASGQNVSLTTAQEQQAQAALQEAQAGLERAYGTLLQAQASVKKAQAQIEKNIIIAPFDGTVARLEYVVGQSALAGIPGITLITDGDYELEMNIPEIDVAKVVVGDSASIILDAYGPDVSWNGVLEGIDLVETAVDGVPSYVSTVTILEPDERIKIGMNARAKIVVAKQDGVVAIPTSYIINTADTHMVLVKQGERKIEQRVIETGMTGSDYFVEVISGLNPGDELLAPSDI